MNRDNETKAIQYYILFKTEFNLNGYTNNADDYVSQALEYYKQFKEDNKGMRVYNSKLEKLKEYYNNELYFRPTIEDLREMKYWL